MSDPRLPEIPHLKLPPSKLLEVLQVVRDRGPNRTAVTRGIDRLFARGTRVAGTVRGMALPAGTRLHFVRASRDSIELAPNGLGVFESGLHPSQYAAVALRAVAVNRFGVSAAGLVRLSDDDLGMSLWVGRARERVTRFRQYIRAFPVARKEWRRADFQKVPSEDWNLDLHATEARSLLAEVLPAGVVISLDEARAKLLGEAWQRRWLATAFDVDRWIVREAGSPSGILTLWKSAGRSIDEILIRGDSYGGLLRRGDVT